jgi:P2-related tail formation protein
MDETQVETATTPTGETVEIVPGTEKPVQVVNPVRIISGSHVLNPQAQALTDAQIQARRNGGFAKK